MEKRLFNVESDQNALLRSVSLQTNLTASELLRRMIDRCLSSELVDELVPECSGQLTLDRSA